MKNIVTYIACGFALIASATSYAQNLTYGVEAPSMKKIEREYRFTPQSDELYIETPGVNIIGHEGKQVVIKALVEEKEEVDERAVGLVGINSSGLKDNTKLGFYVGQEGSITRLRKLPTGEDTDSITILVPKDIKIAVNGFNSPWSEQNISLSNLSNSIEVSTTMGDISLREVSGPMTIKTTHGNIEAIFDRAVKGPVSLISTLGYVDLAIPAKTAADLELRTALGEILADESFDIKLEEKTNKNRPSIEGEGQSRTSKGENNIDLSELKNLGVQIQTAVSEAVPSILDQISVDTGIVGIPTSNHVRGTVNGGGEKIILRTTHGKIYLRKSNK